MREQHPDRHDSHRKDWESSFDTSDVLNRKEGRFVQWLEHVLQIPITRREFLTTPKRWIDEFIEAVKSRNEGAPLMDTFIEASGETVANLALIFMGIEGAKDKRLAIDARSESVQEHMADFKEKLGHMEALHRIFGGVSEQINTLYDHYKDQYYVRHEGAKIQATDSDGDPITIQMPDTWVWEDPFPLVEAGVTNANISEWKGILNPLASSLAQTTNEAASMFAIQNKNSLSYQTSLADTGPIVIQNLVLYGGVGLTYAFSEEILENAAVLLRANLSGYGDVVDRVLSTYEGLAEVNIKRRTLFKLAFASFLAWQIREIQKKFVVDTNASVLDDTKRIAESIVEQMIAPPIESFRRYFGHTPLEYRSMLVRASEESEKASNTEFIGYKADETRQHFANTHESAVDALKAFDAYFKYDPREVEDVTIPPELTDFLQQAWATREIMHYVNQRNLNIYTAHIGDAIKLVGGLTVVSLLTEGAVFPGMNRIGEWVKRLKRS